MVVKREAFSVEIVNAYTRRSCQEVASPYAASETLVQVNPHDEYLIRLEVQGNVDPGRNFLCYVSIDDVYLGYRQCISQKAGCIYVGLYNFQSGIMTGTDQPMQFHDAKLLMKGNNNNGNSNLSEPFDIQQLQMGKVTVKVYDGIVDNSIFIHSADAYEPGNYLTTTAIRCCCDYELGKDYLSLQDYNLISRAQLKRKEQTVNTSFAMSMETATKRMRTESGFKAMAVAGRGVQYDSMNATMAEG